MKTCGSRPLDGGTGDDVLKKVNQYRLPASETLLDMRSNTLEGGRVTTV
ncbi:hypothetical protein OH492_20455 [Vibrio chagasii]|nr:hypothetical protein [Vibrio chagasii]